MSKRVHLCQLILDISAAILATIDNYRVLKLQECVRHAPSKLFFEQYGQTNTIIQIVDGVSTRVEVAYNKIKDCWYPVYNRRHLEWNSLGDLLEYRKILRQRQLDDPTELTIEEETEVCSLLAPDKLGISIRL